MVVMVQSGGRTSGVCKVTRKVSRGRGWVEA